MPLKLLHTADWHLGQLFHEYDRSIEHEAFLNWLVNLLVQKNIDVLLMSGDVFDVSNPSAASTGLYYSFLRKVTTAVPGLQIIITAGNHDSPGRLEAPKMLLEAFNISIVGLVQKNADLSINYDKLILPLKNKTGETKAWCMTIPFLRQGDYPFIAGSKQPYADGVTKFYMDAYAYALTKKKEGQAIIAMGHLHALNAEPSDEDKSERVIMGGVEFVPASTFDDGLAYTALGHIHKAQKVAKKDTIRYAGSPVPMSFSEINYKHQVVYVELEGEMASVIEPIEIPVTVALIKMPAKPKILTEVLLELEQLPEANNDINTAPYLEVNVLLDTVEPTLKYRINKALENKHVRLTRIKPFYKEVENDADKKHQQNTNVNEIKPVEMLHSIYKKKFNDELPEELLNLFNEVIQKLETPEK